MTTKMPSRMMTIGINGAIVMINEMAFAIPLNQILTEMDGFDASTGVIVLAATNRPETLDPALLRPGRFDRHVLVDRPDVRGREGILVVHTRKIPLADDVDVAVLARGTAGFSGADLANLVNEAALAATRRGSETVSMADFTAALERIVAGLEKRNRVLNPREREIVAYHEMGHALVAAAVPGSDKVHKVSIIPRGIGALGYTIHRPTEDRYLMTREELGNKMAVLLGGRAAEQLVFGHLSTGAADIFANTGGVMEAALRTVIELVCGIKVEKLFDHANIVPVRGFEGVRYVELPITQVSPEVPAKATKKASNGKAARGRGIDFMAAKEVR